MPQGCTPAAGSYEALTPTFTWRSGALGSLTYLLLVHVLEVRMTHACISGTPLGVSRPAVPAAGAHVCEARVLCARVADRLLGVSRPVMPASDACAWDLATRLRARHSAGGTSSPSMRASPGLGTPLTSSPCCADVLLACPATACVVWVAHAVLLPCALASCCAQLCELAVLRAQGVTVLPAQVRALEQGADLGSSAVLGTWAEASCAMQVLPTREGKALVTAIFVAHAVLSEVTGRPLDFTLPVGRAAHAVCCVPMPGLVAASAKPAAPAESKKKR